MLRLHRKKIFRPTQPFANLWVELRHSPNSQSCIKLITSAAADGAASGRAAKLPSGASRCRCRPPALETATGADLWLLETAARAARAHDAKIRVHTYQSAALCDVRFHQIEAFRIG